MELGIEGMDSLRADEKLDGCGSSVGREIFAAIDNDERTEFVGFFAGKNAWLGGRQEDRGQEHKQAGRCRKPATPEAKGKNDQGCAGESEEDTEGHPGFWVTANAEEFWNQQDQGKESADQYIAETRGSPFVMRCSSGGGRSHLLSIC